VGVFVPHTSNRWQDDSVHFKEEENESRVGTETCTLVTILESKESEKGNNDLKSSLLEIDTEVGTEVGTEMEMEMEPFSWAFTFFKTVLSVKRMGDSAFLWEGVRATLLT
jgi:hypothetical protein